VEAAGVEPASESTPSQDSTCVAVLEYSQATSKNGGNRGPLAPIDLAAARRNRPRQPACFYDIRSPPDRRGRGGRHGLIKPRERAACWQLLLFHRIYESMELGMHPASPYSRRSRVAPKRVGRMTEAPTEQALPSLYAPRGSVVKLFVRLELSAQSCLTLRVRPLHNADHLRTCRPAPIPAGACSNNRWP
jgi:hypothetical protein